MPKITLQPSDETADNGVHAGSGEDTDEALGGFPARAGLTVILFVTFQLDTSADSTVGTSTCRAKVQYSTNDGSSWSDAESIFSQSINGTPSPDTDTSSGTLSATGIGDVNDLSQFRIRALGDNTFTGDGSGTSRAQVTDWEITYHTAVGIVQA